MKIYSVIDKEFNEYGKIIGGDFSELIKVLHTKECPNGGVVYVPSDAKLENTPSFAFLQSECFGGLPIQIGYCNGNNNVLNCLEYHKSSEINIAESDVILLLGKQQDIKDGKCDTANVKAFRVPSGMAVELYATTLHYAPCGNDFRVAIVLPKGTNYDIPSSEQTNMLWASNKWLLAHPNSNEAKHGAHIGLIGDNIVLREL